jgi:hypothetical protein
MDTRMRWISALALVVAFVPSNARGEGTYRIEVLKEPPPASLSAEIKAEINPKGYRLLDDQGKSYAEFWLRRAIPATGKPAGAKGAILFPVLTEGELLGVLRYPGEGHDYRDQAIAQGVYTVRYGLQPVNGDHLGVSPNRDYALLLPAGKDAAPGNLVRKKLEDQSAEAAGSSHPAVLMLLEAPPAEVKAEPAVVHEESRNTWGAVVPLNLAVKGDAAPAALHVQLVLVGAAMN